MILRSKQKTSHHLKAIMQEKSFFHTIKGVARTIGANRLCTASETIEKMIDNKEIISATEELEEFKRSAAEINKILTEFINNGYE